MHALKNIFVKSHSHHRYIIEPQSLQYLAHGDLWDHLYLQSRAPSERVFLPLTLEMGSRLWVKKNPRQLFSRHGRLVRAVKHETIVEWTNFAHCVFFPRLLPRAVLQVPPGRWTWPLRW